MKEIAYHTMWGDKAFEAQKAVYQNLRELDLWLTGIIERANRQRDEVRCPFVSLHESDLFELRPEGHEGSRFRSSRGTWIQLQPPGGLLRDSVEDVRHRFFDAEPERLEFHVGKRREAIEVVDQFREGFLFCLKSVPPKDAEAGLSIDVGLAIKQRSALFELMHKPMPHHIALQRLLVPETIARWPDVTPVEPADWFFPTDVGADDGSDAQRHFVSVALGTPDLAVLEGPPGSGKTRVICELILQLAARGERVLLCSSTHTAVDNVLERLQGAGFIGDTIDAIRVGRVERTDPAVAALQLDGRADKLSKSLRITPREAERLLIDSAQLVCGTTTGVARPLDLQTSKESVAAPRFDVLIVDEASKTPLAELLVPAIFCRRIIIVGDTKQLSPFSNQDDVAAAIAAIAPPVDTKTRKPVGMTFGGSEQRASLFLNRLKDSSRHKLGLPTTIVEEEHVVARMWETLEVEDETHPMFVVSATRHSLFAGSDDEDDDFADDDEDVAFPDDDSIGLSSNSEVSLEDLMNASGGLLRLRIVESTPNTSDRLRDPRVVALEILGTPEGVAAAAAMLAADWIFVPKHLVARAAPYLPPSVHLASRGQLPPVLSMREHHFISNHAYASDVKVAVDDDGKVDQSSFGGEVAWRLARLEQLGLRAQPQKRARLENEITSMLPRDPSYQWLRPSLDTLARIGLRSSIDILHRGLGNGAGAAIHRGLPAHVRHQRFGLLTHQHRMHPDIAKFSRVQFYDNQALLDAPTVLNRAGGWPIRDAHEQPLPPRFLMDVRGHEDRGRNPDEVAIIRKLLERLHAATGPNGPRREVAVLSFYNAQTNALRDMLRTLTGSQRGETRFKYGALDIVCSTVDRFQGREADFVMLSFRNTHRAGHIDSPTRLNVALTRARHGLALVGARSMLQRSHVVELEHLAAETPVVEIRADMSATTPRRTSGPPR